MHWREAVNRIPLLLRFHCDARSLHTRLDKEKESMSSTTLSRLSGIPLLLGAVVSVIAGLMTLFFDSSLSASPSTIQSPLWSPYWSLIFVALALVLMGLPAFSLRQTGGRGGVLGLIGVFLVVLGSFLGMAMVAYFVSIMPLLAARAPHLINAGCHRASCAGNRCHTGESLSTVGRCPPHGCGNPQPIGSILRPAVPAPG